jgi:hypothetical protein
VPTIHLFHQEPTTGWHQAKDLSELISPISVKHFSTVPGFAFIGRHIAPFSPLLQV